MSSARRKQRKRIQPALQPPKAKRKRCETTKKLGYATKGDALGAASRESRKIAVKRAYLCGFCSRWHLTSQEKRT